MSRWLSFWATSKTRAPIFRSDSMAFNSPALRGAAFSFSCAVTRVTIPIAKTKSPNIRMIKHSSNCIAENKNRRREIIPLISRITVYKGSLDWIQEGSRKCCKQISPANLFFSNLHARMSKGGTPNPKTRCLRKNLICIHSILACGKGF